MIIIAVILMVMGAVLISLSTERRVKVDYRTAFNLVRSIRKAPAKWTIVKAKGEDWWLRHTSGKLIMVDSREGEVRLYPINGEDVFLKFPVFLRFIIRRAVRRKLSGEFDEITELKS